MTKPELQAELRARGLAVSGTKSELQLRLSSASAFNFSGAGKAHELFSSSLRSSVNQSELTRPTTRSKRPPIPVSKTSVPSRGRRSISTNVTEIKNSLIVFDDEYDVMPMTKAEEASRAQSSQSNVRRSGRLSHASINAKENRPHTSDTILRRSSLYSKANEIASECSLTDSAKKRRRRSMADSVNRALMQLGQGGNCM